MTPMAAADELHGLLVVDKGSGPTSHDVVVLARRVLDTRAVGHTGTLDPLATGVLVLVIGEATKLVNSLGAQSKRYRATVRLGSSTTTLDAQGEVEAHAPVPVLTRAHVEAEAARFLGEIEQRAPRVSALKVAGERLYRSARRGQMVEPPLRRVRLVAIQVTAIRETELELELACGPGFYVRSLARDLAERLGTLGHLSALRRTQNGAYGLDLAVPFEQLRAARADATVRGEVRARVIALAEVCRQLPHVVLDAEAVEHARHGRAVRCPDALPEVTGVQLALDRAGAPVALLESAGETLRVVRGFRPLD